MTYISWVRIIKSEKGAVTIVEAAFIFPLIFIVLGTLIMVSIYSLQKASFITVGEQISLYVSRVKANANEHSYRKINNFGPNFTPDLEEIDVINSLERRSYQENWVSKIPEQEKLGKQLDEIINKYTLIFPGIVEKEIKTVGLGIRQYIVVELRLNAKVPMFVTVLGLDSFWNDSFTARSIVNDQVSFVNDIDFIIDYSLYFCDYFRLDEKISDYIKRGQNTVGGGD